jgi:hypothetical protein
MKLEVFLLADSAETVDRGKVSIEGAGITRVTSDVMPFVVTRLAAVARFVFARDEERTAPYSVRVRWVRPDGSGLHSPPVQVRPREYQEVPVAHDEERGFFYIVQMRDVSFPEPGLYRMEVLVDGVSVGERRVLAIQETESEAT